MTLLGDEGIRHGYGVKEARNAPAASNRGRQHGQLDQDYARIRVHVSDTTTVTHDQAIGGPTVGMAIAELTGGDASTTESTTWNVRDYIAGIML